MSDTTVELEPKLQSIVKELDGLSLLEASKIVKYLEGHWGVSAAAPVAAAAAPAGGGGAAAAEEKTAFDVILEAVADSTKKIAVIKEVRAIAGLGLAEAKALVEGAPKTVKAGATKDEAAAMKKQLEDAGGKVKLA
ncbi:MAG: 50S ribosomal protein L7/L12 [Planctomycetes bacterium]|nr:50S ribosomal protein L7/L12 [Planctomycetota bacterium]